MFNRKISTAVLVVCISFLVSVTARAQYKLETCEDLKVIETHYGINTVETATCVNPTTQFSPKGETRNVNLLYTFPKQPTGAGLTFMITRDNADGEYVENKDYMVSPNHTSAYARFTINKAGKYFVRLANYYNKSQVWATIDFTVGADAVGPRSTGNTAAGGGNVWICKSVDDNWNCVGGSNEWPANKGFDVLFKNPTPVGAEFIGIIFYKQDASGKDVEFINEYQQNIGEKNRFYATGGNEISLPTGTYSLYIIPWGKRELNAHNGNLTEYFAKTTVTVR
ncbi:MAG TPA: hypothetical protein VE863_11665 [Pyrinomonadaceae bacterium]|jgi:hypothetical protein|nr:hypothetical protein [Pyrinomonadaceae bacterium]